MNNSLDLFLSLARQFGWLGNWLFLFLALAECVPFAGGLFPGGTLIYFAGVLAAQGYFRIGDIFIYVAVGAALGDYLNYSVGRWGGHWLERYKVITPAARARAEDFFRKYGDKSLLWGRFIGPIRAIVPFVAGASEMPLGSFLFWDIASAIIWAGADTMLGYFSGNILAAVIRQWSRAAGWLILALALILLIYWFIRKHGQSFREYFRRQNDILVTRLLSGPWLKYLDENYPAVSELYRAAVIQGKIIGLVLGIGLLLSLYIITSALSLF